MCSLQDRALAGRRTASGSHSIEAAPKRVCEQCRCYAAHSRKGLRYPQNPKAAWERQVHDIRQLFEESGGRPTMFLA